MKRYKTPNDKLNCWVEGPNGGTWEYCYYKCCMLGIRQDDDGKYIPLCNGSPNVRIENWSFKNNTPLKLDTLQEAKDHLFRYVDIIRENERMEAETNYEKMRAILIRYNENRA